MQRFPPLHHVFQLPQKVLPVEHFLSLEVFSMRAAGSGFVLDKEAHGSGLDMEFCCQ